MILDNAKKERDFDVANIHKSLIINENKQPIAVQIQYNDWVKIEKILQFHKQSQKNMRKNTDNLKEKLLKISRRCGSLPILDFRSADEILGYDMIGLPNGN